MASLVLTVLGDDRPGLVSAVSAAVGAHHGSWERSEMARLSGKFAGIVLVSVPDAEVEGLRTALAALAAAGLHVEAQGHKGRSRVFRHVGEGFLRDSKYSSFYGSRHQRVVRGKLTNDAVVSLESLGQDFKRRVQPMRCQRRGTQLRGDAPYRSNRFFQVGFHARQFGCQSLRASAAQMFREGRAHF